MSALSTSNDSSGHSAHDLRDPTAPVGGTHKPAVRVGSESVVPASVIGIL
jgi:hypothetical protein